MVEQPKLLPILQSDPVRAPSQFVPLPVGTRGVSCNTLRLHGLTWQEETASRTP